MARMDMGARIAAHTDWLTPNQAAAELNVEVHRIHEWAKRERDPLPVHLPPGNCREGIIFRDEMNRWVLENWQTRAKYERRR